MLIFFFFFSSRRRHTRFDCDWSSDVCSSDLGRGIARPRAGGDPRGDARRLAGVRRARERRAEAAHGRVRPRRSRSEERRVGKSVDLGGRRIIKKKKETGIEAPEKRRSVILNQGTYRVLILLE